MSIICLILAAKTEEYDFDRVGLEGFINLYNQTEKDKLEISTKLIEKYEIQLCKNLGFDFLVHTPLHAIDFI